MRSTDPRFEDLSHDGQVALALWALFVKAEPADRMPLPDPVYARAVGDIATTIGLRSRKARNYEDIHRKRRKNRTKKAVSA